MRFALIASGAVLLAFGAACSESSPTNPCEEGCVPAPIVRASLKWLSDAQGYSPSAIVLDAARTDVALREGGRAGRGMDRETLSQVVRSTGIRVGSRESNVVCQETDRGPGHSRRGRPDCEVKGGQILVMIDPDFYDPGQEQTGAAQLLISYEGRIHAGRWGRSGYLLTLKKENLTWRVVSAAQVLWS